jgi:TPR repeat protein
MRFLILAVLMPLFTGTALAQDGYPNGCDPTLKGAAQACYQLSNLYGRGNKPPFPIDPARAEKLLRIDEDFQANACAAGDNDGLPCLRSFRSLMASPRPSLTPEQKSQGIKKLRGNSETACLLGAPYACQQRGFSGPDQGDWVARVKPAVSARYAHHKTNCDTGNARACAYAGSIFSEFLAAKRSEESGQGALLLRGCLEGEQNCNLLASILRGFLRGSEQSQRFAETAVVQLDNACDDGIARSCAARANATRMTPAQVQDFKEKACDLGHTDSCAGLATKDFYDYNKTGRTDVDLLQQATENFARACDLGDQVSCHTLEHISKG